MKIYLAARYSRREELEEYKKQLEGKGHVVTSRWLLGNHKALDGDVTGHGKLSQQFAQDDVDDLLDAHMCISFTEDPRTAATRGGRHVEFGIAYALDKPNYIVGPRENVFHCLPEVQQFTTWEECLATL